MENSIEICIVKSATGLKNNRFSLDPKMVVQVSIDGQIYVTSLSKRTTSPVWNEDFIV